MFQSQIILYISNLAGNLFSRVSDHTFSLPVIELFREVEKSYLPNTKIKKVWYRKKRLWQNSKYSPLQHKRDQSKIQSFDMVSAQLILELVLERTFVDTYRDYGLLILNVYSFEQKLYMIYILDSNGYLCIKSSVWLSLNENMKLREEGISIWEISQ